MAEANGQPGVALAIANKLSNHYGTFRTGLSASLAKGRIDARIKLLRKKADAGENTGEGDAPPQSEAAEGTHEE